MKVVVQNGADHPLTRGVLEELLAQMPEKWKGAFDRIVILAFSGVEPSIVFYPKAKLLEISGPENEKLVPMFLSEFLISCSMVVEKGEIPKTISPALRKRHGALVSRIFSAKSFH